VDDDLPLLFPRRHAFAPRIFVWPQLGCSGNRHLTTGRRPLVLLFFVLVAAAIGGAIWFFGN
jgi:hypothetical protein